MKRRSKPSGKVSKARRKATTPRRSSPAKAVPGRRSATTGKETEAARTTRERDEALEQQRATSEVLRAISNSPTDTASTLSAIAESVARLLEVTDAEILTVEGDALRAVAKHGSALQWPMGTARILSRDWVTGRAVIDRTVVHVADLQAQDHEFPQGAAYARQYGHRTTLAVPLLREGSTIGAILIRRFDVRPFTDKQIALVQNFAAQAVIAIENARLLNELRQRTTDLTQSLEQQTATSEVLRVISSSPTNVQPVLDTIVRTAVSLCNSYDAVILLREDEHLSIAAHHGPMALDFESLPLGRDFVSGRTVIDGVPVHVPDFMAAGAEFPRGREVAKRLKQRTVLGLPLRREGQTIGCLFLRRTEVLPFSDKQIELLTTFADQAVIAIENVRLFEAEQQRTRELSESLEQQTATADVLRVISSSPGDLNPVFQTMLENAVHICEAKYGNLFIIGERGCRWTAGVGTPPKLAEYFTRRTLFQPTLGSHLDRVVRTKQVSHTADDTKEAVIGAAARLGGARSTVCVPMLKDGALVGAIFIYRIEVRPFTDKQIELVKNFAAQAVIAIENTRLLQELRQSLEQQTATSEVLRVISASPGELEPIFQSMLENATRICEAKFGVLFHFNGDAFHLAADVGSPPAFAEFLRGRGWFRPVPGSGLDHVLQSKTARHTADYGVEAVSGPPVTLGGARSTIDVPMLKDDVLVGAISGLPARRCGPSPKNRSN